MGELNQVSFSSSSISSRLAEIRRLHYGERGRSSFARDLGVPVTSYVHYETDRTPPADLLFHAAELTNTSLEWLLAGKGDRSKRIATADASPASQLADELMQVLLRSPHLIHSATEFVKLLATMADEAHSQPRRTPAMLNSESLIPVVGSTAAGLARFWHEIEADHGGEEADAQLERIIEQHTQLVVASGAESSSQQRAGDPIALVQYSQPDDSGFLEFLSASELKARYPAAVAWRIDGDSMSPRYRDGDFVITCPGYPAVEMQPCVARQVSQIGVNCKLFQLVGEEVVLIPINESCAIQRFPRQQLLWSWRVLASVRLS